VRDGEILNDETVAAMVRSALVQAEAGADIIAPSDMMDGRVGAIRDALDANGFQDVAIMSYATKFHSAFYGPYREAIGTAGLLQGDKKTYYLDHANSDEAVREAARVRALLEPRGSMIGPYDVLLAGHARSAGLMLVTANTGEFSRVMALSLEDWHLPQGP